MDSVRHQTPPGLTKKGCILIQRQVVRYKPSENPVAKKDNQLKAPMNAADIDYQASKKAFDTYNNSMANKVEKGLLFVGLPLVASLREGALSNAKNVSGKVKNTLKTAGAFAAVFAFISGSYKAIDAATRKVPVLREFRKDHPGLTSVGALAGTAGATVGAAHLFDNLSSKAAKVDVIAEKLINPIKEQTAKIGKQLNKTKFLDDAIFKPTQQFFQTNKVGKFVGNWGFPLAAGAVVLKFVTDLNSITQNKKQIKQQLENDQKQNQQLASMNPFADGVIVKTEKINKIWIVPAKKEAASKS